MCAHGTDEAAVLRNAHAVISSVFSREKADHMTGLALAPTDHTSHDFIFWDADKTGSASDRSLCWQWIDP